jgi:hypothetical protein
LQQVRQFSNIHRNPPRLIPRQQFRRRSSPRLILEIDIGERLTVMVVDNKAGGLFLDRPGRRSGEGSFSDVDFSKSESFYDHPAYWPSSIQHLVQLAEL